MSGPPSTVRSTEHAGTKGEFDSPADAASYLVEGDRAELEESAAASARTGLTAYAARVRAFLAAHRQEGPRAAVGPGPDAQIQLLTALELLGRQSR